MALKVRMYEITFTEAFKDGLSKLPKETHSIIDRHLGLLRIDPFAKNPQAKRLKNAPCTFRVRIGKSVRMLYRVHSKDQRVVIQTIGTRDHIYDDDNRSPKPLTDKEARQLTLEFKGYAEALEIVPEVHLVENVPVALSEQEYAVPVEVEEVLWITHDELFLLHIPAAEWDQVVEAGSVEVLRSLPIDEWTKLIVEDYWTHPSATHVDKIYSLSVAQEAGSIAKQPLSFFLVALDPEQSSIRHKLLGRTDLGGPLRPNGPYLLKGSAGTGKSLVGLYYISEQAINRAGESLFDSTSGRFGVITYTNTLVDASVGLLRSISPKSVQNQLDCITFDKIVYDIVQTALGGRPNALNKSGIVTFIDRYVLPAQAQEAQLFIERVGLNFVADEIEQVLYGYGISSVGDYIALKRSGRKVPLREADRRHLWAIFEKFRCVCQERAVQTFEEWRLIALQYLQKHPEYPRYASLFVDEAQDFSKVARQICVELVVDVKNLLLAADSGQSIYACPPSWSQSDAALQFRGKAHQLQKSYRATREIGRAIAPLRLELDDGELLTGNAGPVFNGPKPTWLDAPLSEHYELVGRLIVEYVNHPTNPVRAGQIAVIVRENQSAKVALQKFSTLGLPAALVAKGHPIDMEGEDVHVVTAHSSKGLGFPFVFVPDVSSAHYPWVVEMNTARDDDQRAQILESEQRLLYVALSRASHRLFMIVDSNNPSPFVDSLDRLSHWS